MLTYLAASTPHNHVSATEKKILLNLTQHRHIASCFATASCSKKNFMDFTSAD